MTKKNLEPLLLTPGPLTTSKSVKEAMLHDWGSRDISFIEMTERVRNGIEKIAGVEGNIDNRTCVLLQGSGTFAMEAAITSLVPRDGKVLAIVNGAYGHRICKICAYHNRTFTSYETEENMPPSLVDLASLLEKDTDISDVAVVHCETTSGILNPISEISKVVTTLGRRLIIDAMSSFGAIPLDVIDPCNCTIGGSSDKCLEGVPGIGFVIVGSPVLVASEGNANSLSLDLYDQWKGFVENGQWRFTPPTHVLAALDQAISEHEAEGGVSGRGARYRKNCQSLIEGMESLGFKRYLPDNLQAPIIVTFSEPEHGAFKFENFYELLKDRGFAIYPGKLTKVDSFRMGCIGDLDNDDMIAAVSAVRDVIVEMGITL